MKTFSQFLAEKSKPRKINWIPPNPDDEHHEIDYQLKNTANAPDWVRSRLNQLSNADEFNRAIQSGTPKKLSRSRIKRTGNTGDTWKNTLNWTEPEKAKRTPTLFRSGNPVQRPILLQHPKKSNERWLIGGHHRITYASNKLRKPVEAHIIK